MKIKESFNKGEKRFFYKLTSLMLSMIMISSVLVGCAGFKQKPISDDTRQLSKQFLSRIVVPDLYSILNSQSSNEIAKVNYSNSLNNIANTPYNLNSTVDIATDGTEHNIEDFEKSYDDIFPFIEDAQLSGEHFALQIKFVLAEVLPEMPITDEWVRLSDVPSEEEGSVIMPPRYAKLVKTANSTTYMSYKYDYIKHDYPSYEFTYVNVTENGGETTIEMQSYSKRYSEEMEYSYRNENGQPSIEKVKHTCFVREQSIRYTKGKLYSNYRSQYTQRADNNDILEKNINVCDFQRLSDKDDMVYGFYLSQQSFFSNYKSGYLHPPYVLSYFGNEKLGYITAKPISSLMEGQQGAVLYKDGYLIFAPERTVYNPFKSILYRVNKDMQHSPPSDEFWEEYLKDFTARYDENGTIIGYTDSDGNNIPYNREQGLPLYEEQYFDSNGLPLYYNSEGKPFIGHTYGKSTFYDVSGRKLYVYIDDNTWEEATTLYDKMYIMLGIRSSITGTSVLLPVANLQGLDYTDVKYKKSEYRVYEDDEHISSKTHDTDSYNIKTYDSFYSNIDYVQMITEGWTEFAANDGYASVVFEQVENKREWQESDFKISPENIEHVYSTGNSFASYFSNDYPGLFVPVNLTNSDNVSKFIVDEYQDSANFYIEYKDKFELDFSLLQVYPEYSKQTTVAQQLNFIETNYFTSMVSAAEREANLIDKVTLVNRDTYEDSLEPIIGSKHFEIYSMLYNGSIIIMDREMSEKDIAIAKMDSGTFRRVYGLLDADKDIFYSVPFADKGNKNSDFQFSGYAKYNTKCLEVELEEFSKTIEGMDNGTYFSATRLEKLNTETNEWEAYSAFKTIIFLPDNFYLMAFSHKSSSNLIVMEQVFVDRADGGIDKLNAFKIKKYNTKT